MGRIIVMPQFGENAEVIKEQAVRLSEIIALAISGEINSDRYETDRIHLYAIGTAMYITAALIQDSLPTGDSRKDEIMEGFFRAYELNDEGYANMKQFLQAVLSKPEGKIN